MPEPPVTLGRLAEVVRSKNAGPFWLTLDVFLRTDEDYDRVIATRIVTADSIGRLYRVAPQTVQVFQLPGLRAIKISFPRPVPAGSFGDRDQHAGQQHVPLSGVIVPALPAADDTHAGQHHVRLASQPVRPSATVSHSTQRLP